MGQIMSSFQERDKLAKKEFNELFYGGIRKMSEQPRCMTCGKNYYKNTPNANDGCKCKPEDKKIIMEVS